MANRLRGPRKLLASVVGYIIVALIALWALRFAIGSLFWMIRSVMAIVVIGGLIALYLKLKEPDDT